MPRRGYAQDAIIQANESRRADLIINGSNVTGNASQKGVGGGISLAETSGTLIVSSVIARNTTGIGGGNSVVGCLPLIKARLQGTSDRVESVASSPATNLQ